MPVFIEFIQIALKFMKSLQPVWRKCPRMSNFGLQLHIPFSIFLSNNSEWFQTSIEDTFGIKRDFLVKTKIFYGDTINSRH